MPLPDVEKLAVQWAKTRPTITTIAAQRISTSLPKEPIFPWLTAFVVGGGVADGHAPMGWHMVQWDSFGAPGAHTPDYDSAYSLASALIEEAFEYQGRVANIGYIDGFQIVSGPRRVNEPDTNWARYMVETMIMTREIV